MTGVTAEEIIRNLEHATRQLRDNYVTSHPHVPIEFIEGFEAASELATRTYLEATTRGDN